MSDPTSNFPPSSNSSTSTSAPPPVQSNSSSSTSAPPHVQSNSSNSTSRTITDRNFPALLTWAKSDDQIKKLIQKKHIDGRIEQAINFANFIESFDDNEEAKTYYKSRDNFYKELRRKYTNKREESGFSATSCKRLKTEGDCYISLLQAKHNKFPQSQSLALDLKRYTSKENIGAVWSCALQLYDDDETCVHKRDIPTALEMYSQQNPPEADPIEALRAQLENTRKELEKKTKELIVANKRIQHTQRPDPKYVMQSTVDQLDATKKIVKDIEKEILFGYFVRDGRDANEVSNYEEIHDFNTLTEYFQENKKSDNPENPKYKIYCLDDIKVVQEVRDIADWKRRSWKHFKIVLETIKEKTKLEVEERVEARAEEAEEEVEMMEEME